jgi:hypothetical protein
MGDCLAARDNLEAIQRNQPEKRNRRKKRKKGRKKDGWQEGK